MYFPKKQSANMCYVLAIVVAVLITAVMPAAADPLPGEALKFQQLPQGYDPGAGVPAPITYEDTDIAASTPIDYYGHDELSTLLLNSADGAFQGIAMADDFADKVDGPILHVRWWGSYLNNQNQEAVRDFLIAFESDVPDPDGDHDSQDDTDPDTFSHPGQVLHWEVVSEVVSLSPGSGTYTEKLVVPAAVTGGEAIYEYNAELKYDPATLDGAFPQQPDEVYWLKIAALVDDDTIRWGWHNRDYTATNTLFGSPTTPPFGEHNDGPWDWDGDGIAGDPDDKDIWHFQDDAVQANTFFNPGLPPPQDLQQTNYIAQRYADGLDGPGGIAGQMGIHQFSKDLAFELYTIPEPSAFLLTAFGLVGLFGYAWRRKRKPGTK